MFIRSACFAIGLLGCVAGARAEWQPAEPPVPPETESAQRARSAPASRGSGPQPAPPVGASLPAPPPSAADHSDGSRAFAGRPESAPAERQPPPTAAEGATPVAGAARSGPTARTANAGLGPAARTTSAGAASAAAPNALPTRATSAGTPSSASTESTASVAAPNAPPTRATSAGAPSAGPANAAFAASPTSAGTADAALPSGAASVGPAQVELAQANTAGGRSDVEALRAFPPAPPPVVPGTAPEQPNSALTSFAPAPAPDPAGAARANAPAQGAAAPDGSATRSNASPQGAAAPAGNAARSNASPQESVASAGSATPAPSSAGQSNTPAQATPASSAGAADGGVPSSELWSAAALFGIGATFDNTVAGVNPLGFGFGVRADYRILPSWSVGARLLYFVGGSVELPTHDVVMQSWLLAAEGAYVLDLDPLTIQPGLALGLYARETNYRGFAPFITEDPTSLSPPDSTRLFFYLAPGLNLSLPLALATPALAPLTLGADVRLDLGFGRRVTSSIQLLGQVGIRF